MFLEHRFLNMRYSISNLYPNLKDLPDPSRSFVNLILIPQMERFFHAQGPGAVPDTHSFGTSAGGLNGLNHDSFTPYVRSFIVQNNCRKTK